MGFLDKTGVSYFWGKIKALVNKSHDELSDRIEEIDWFGSGTSIPSDSDLDNYKTEGKYFVSSTSISNSIVNAPYKGTNYTLFVFNRTSGKSLTQMAISLSNKIALRSASSTGTYSKWVVVGTDEIDSHNTNASAHSDIRTLIENLATEIEGITVPTKVSELQNDSGYFNKDDLSSTITNSPTTPASMGSVYAVYRIINELNNGRITFVGTDVSGNTHTWSLVGTSMASEPTED